MHPFEETGAEPRSAPHADEIDMVARLQAGDERAFEALVERHHTTMLAVARAYVRSHAAAEDVVQEAWLGVLNGLARFEGRSSLRTWIMRIVANIARSHRARDARSLPFSSLEAAGEQPAVTPDRFRGPDDPYPGDWVESPKDWRSIPENVLLGRETLAIVMRAIADLPPAQATVLRMRDVEGWTAEEVCSALAISAGNQRVLLHRARSRVREALEQYFGA